MIAQDERGIDICTCYKCTRGFYRGRWPPKEWITQFLPISSHSLLLSLFWYSPTFSWGSLWQVKFLIQYEDSKFQMNMPLWILQILCTREKYFRRASAIKNCDNKMTAIVCLNFQMHLKISIWVIQVRLPDKNLIGFEIILTRILRAIAIIQTLGANLFARVGSIQVKNDFDIAFFFPA